MNRVRGITQGSYARILTFGVLIRDLLFLTAKCKICKFADGMNSCGINSENIFSNLIKEMDIIYEWFVCNSVKASADKFQFTILINTSSHTFQKNDTTIKSTLSVTLLGITIDSKMNFKDDIDNIMKRKTEKH